MDFYDSLFCSIAVGMYSASVETFMFTLLILYSIQEENN